MSGFNLIPSYKSLSFKYLFLSCHIDNDPFELQRFSIEFSIQKNNKPSSVSFYVDIHFWNTEISFGFLVGVRK